MKKHETLGLTQPFHYDLRGRGVGLVQGRSRGNGNTGLGNDIGGWEFYKDTRILYGSVVIDQKTHRHPVPGGRTQTLKCVEKFNRQKELPAGTQFALIERAFSISDEGELVLSPLIVSVSLRAYVGVTLSKRTGNPRATQSVAEFVMQPRRLMQGDAVMKALNPQDHRYEAGAAQDIVGGTFDLFESEERTGPRLNNCVNCHGQPHPTATRRIGLKTARPRFLREGSPAVIMKTAAARKRNDKTWKALHALWQADSKKKEKRFPPTRSIEATTRK